MKVCVISIHNQELFLKDNRKFCAIEIDMLLIQQEIVHSHDAVAAH